jgi:hypothetical protein
MSVYTEESLEQVPQTIPPPTRLGSRVPSGASYRLGGNACRASGDEANSTVKPADKRQPADRAGAIPDFADARERRIISVLESGFCPGDYRRIIAAQCRLIAARADCGLSLDRRSLTNLSRVCFDLSIAETNL